MDWRIKLEAKTGWGEITEVEIATVSGCAVSATDEDVGLSLTECKAILSTLQQAIVTAQLDEYVTSARVCRSCLTSLSIRGRRFRKLQTLFGTMVVPAPRIRVCDCANELGPHDKSKYPARGKAAALALPLRARRHLLRRFAQPCLRRAGDPVRP